MILRRTLVLAAAALVTAALGVGGAGASPVLAPATEASPIPGATVKTVRYGPFKLKGNPTGTHTDRSLLQELLSNRLDIDIELPCEDCWIVQAEPDLVYEDGSNANVDTGPMMHHIVFAKSGARDTACPWSPQTMVGQRVFASGNERTTRALPAGYGYRVRPGDRWNMIRDLMTLSTEEKTVYVEMKYHILPADTQLKELTPVWMDAGGCLLPYYNVPAGSGEHVKTWEWTSTISGKLIATGGHVHHGGTSVTLSNVTTGETYCTSVAKVGETPEFIDRNGNKEISSMSTCHGDPVGLVKKGDRLRITSRYTLTNHAHPNVMGIMIASIAQD